MLRPLAAYLFREPRGGDAYWRGIPGRFRFAVACAGVLTYCLLAVLGFSAFGHLNVAMVIVGLSGVLLFTAELLPRDRTELAGGLRIGGVCGLFVAIAALVVL